MCAKRDETPATPQTAAPRKPVIDPTPAFVGSGEARPPAPPAPVFSWEGDALDGEGAAAGVGAVGADGAAGTGVSVGAGTVAGVAGFDAAADAGDSDAARAGAAAGPGKSGAAVAALEAGAAADVGKALAAVNAVESSDAGVAAGAGDASGAANASSSSESGDAAGAGADDLANAGDALAEGGTGTAKDRRSIVVVVVAALTLCLVAAAVLTFVDEFAGSSAQPRLPDEPAQSDRSNPDAEAAADQRAAEAAVNAALGDLSLNEEGAFEQCVQRFLDAYDAGVSTGSEAAQTSYGFADLGITAQDVAPRLLSGFEASVVEVDVYESTAWVTVSVASRSLSDQAEAFSRAVKPHIAQTQWETEEEYRAFLNDAYLAAFDNLPTRERTALLTIDGEGGAWEVPQSALDQMLAASWCATEGN